MEIYCTREGIQKAEPTGIGHKRETTKEEAEKYGICFSLVTITYTNS